MKPNYISEDSLARLVEELSSKGQLVAPVREGRSFEFARIKRGEQVCLTYTTSTIPPKSALLPQVEELFSYDVKSGEVRPPEEGDERLVLLGVRPCDSSAFSVLDRVMGRDRADPYYMRRRDRITVVGLSCSQPRETCFCDAFGTGPIDGSGDDITFTKVNGGYVVRSKTAKGARFARAHSKHFRAATKKEVDEFESRSREIKAMLASGITSEGLADRMGKSLEDPCWEEASERCIECGVCSFVCPTCYCFDVTEQVEGDSGKRYRGWDTCQSCRFSRMAGGLDPRPTKVDRFKHRFHHKLSYVPMAFNVMACVGCGRCVSLCPTNVDIREVIRKWQ